MIEIASLSQLAYQVVEELAGKIGPRPAGSEAEEQARARITEQMTAMGYEVERIPVKYAEIPFFSPFYLIGCIALLAGWWLLIYAPLATVLVPLTLILLPQMEHWVVSRRRMVKESANLLARRLSAENTVPDSRRSLILCAHIDSGRANAFEGTSLLKIYHRMLYFAQRAAYALASLGVLKTLGFPYPEILGVLVGGITGLVGLAWLFFDIYSQVGKPIRYSPGAQDNASGVGVVLALASYFSEHPPETMQLQYLFTSAEETGLHGARAFADRLARVNTLAVLNFDMVGAGDELHFVSKEGTIFPIYTDRNLNQCLVKAAPHVSAIWYTVRSGDYLPFLQKRIPAASLQTGGNWNAELAYHTIRDKPEVVQQSALDMTIRTAIDWINLLGKTLD